MAKKDEEGTEKGSKEPFISSEDRPEVKIDLDTPISELRVRDLSSILGFFAGKSPHFEVGKTSLKDFFDKEFPEVAKDWVKELKIEKIEKPEKPEKFEKLEKYEKPEKEKLEKIEKPELKDLKYEKIEREPVFDPGRIPGPDPRFDALVEAVAGLQKQVSQLVDQVEALRKKAGG